MIQTEEVTEQIKINSVQKDKVIHLMKNIIEVQDDTIRLFKRHFEKGRISL